MKNNIIKIGVLFIAFSLLYCCNDEFLERYPLDEVSGETFWKSENDLIIYNNSIYNIMRSGDVPILIGHDIGVNSKSYSFWFLDAGTDNSAPNYSSVYWLQNLRAGIHVVPSSAQEFGWRDLGWSFLRAINVGLVNYNKAEIAQSVIDKYAAEARLFRGLFYADKVSKFGDVPWIDHELNIDSEELYGTRDPREEVMNNVLSDLTFACENLPEDWGDGNAPGRINRWAALLAKSRVCLFEGTWRKYHGGEDVNMWLQEAADAAKEVIDCGRYSLYSTGDPQHDYQAIHLIPADLTGIKEVVYWRRYAFGVMYNRARAYQRAASGGATKDMVEDYLCTDGLPITLSPLYKGDSIYENIFENRDPRLRQTILHPEDRSYYKYNKDDGLPYPRLTGTPGGLTSTTGYHIIKYYEVVASHASTEETPAIVLRLAEAFLNYAEAKAELGTITQVDLDLSINKLRDRVGMPHLELNNVPVDPRYVNDGVTPLIVEIRRERRVELYMEGFRYDDLRRWKQGKKLEVKSYGMRWDAANKARFDPLGKVTLKSSIEPISGIEYIEPYKGTSWENPVFKESKHYLWPIPLSAISQNPNLTQTPGWE